MIPRFVEHTVTRTLLSALKRHGLPFRETRHTVVAPVSMTVSSAGLYPMEATNKPYDEKRMEVSLLLMKEDCLPADSHFG